MLNVSCRSFRSRGRDIFLRFGSALKLVNLRCDAEFTLHMDVALGNCVALKSMHLFWGRSAHSFTMHRLISAFRKAGYMCHVSVSQQVLGRFTYLT